MSSEQQSGLVGPAVWKKDFRFFVCLFVSPVESSCCGPEVEGISILELEPGQGWLSLLSNLDSFSTGCLGHLY